MVCRAPVQTELRHNMGLAPVLLDDAMKATKEAIVDYAGKCDPKPDWWTKEGGGTPSAGANHFDANKTPTCLSTTGLHSAS
jgi:hypothetical protein